MSTERSGKLYIPVNGTPATPLRHSNVNDDSMQLDDTKDKVYIYNLDDELRDIDEEEEKLIFLPDIERKLTKIPQSVLTSTSQPVPNQEMVLYTVPSSLTVPEKEDNVRKAIIETRERARQKQVDEADPAYLNNGNSIADISLGHAGQHLVNSRGLEEDEDAMDIG